MAYRPFAEWTIQIEDWSEFDCLVHSAQVLWNEFKVAVNTYCVIHLSFGCVQEPDTQTSNYRSSLICAKNIQWNKIDVKSIAKNLYFNKYQISREDECRITDSSLSIYFATEIEFFWWNLNEQNENVCSSNIIHFPNLLFCSTALNSKLSLNSQILLICHTLTQINDLDSKICTNWLENL